MTSKQKYRILVVDDDVDICEMMEECLKEKYEVVTVDSGRQALEKLEEVEPDLIILDMMMPLMDGFETCQSIRKRHYFEHTPILFLSAHNTRGNIGKVYESGGSLFLAKPIDPIRLLKNVEICFSQNPPPPRAKRFSMQQLKLVNAEHAASEKGAGRFAAFRASLQGVSHPAIAGQEPQQEALLHPVLPRVLVVEDDPELLSVIEYHLKEKFEVVTALDGLTGADKANRYLPDLIVMDIMMPKLNGFQLCQALRGASAFAHTPIIIITGRRGGREQELFAPLGVNTFLLKPFEMEHLIGLCLGFTHSPGFHIRPKTLSILSEDEPGKTAPETASPPAPDGRFNHEDRFQRALNKSEQFFKPGGGQ